MKHNYKRSSFYSAKQFAIFRAIFGLYLTWHFYTLLTFESELFTTNGMIPDAAMNPTWNFFPALPYLDQTETTMSVFITILMCISLLFAGGFHRKWCALFLWYGWAYLLNRNVLISNPGIPYVGWLLLVCVVIPGREGFELSNWNRTSDSTWYMPEVIYWGAWFIMAAGYTISGLHKLSCPSWINGSALEHVLSGMLARDYFLPKFLLYLPKIVLQINTWIALAVEILCLPLGLFYHVRKWYWIILVVMHLGVICLIDFTDLTLGVLMIHFFTFDGRWLS
jgi:hypothetical protein